MGHFYKLKAKIQNFMQSIFRIPAADELAMIELEEAKRSLLQMQTALDYSKRMVDYHSDRIKRLNAYVAKATTEETPA
jgi:hypothetical protein